MLGANDRRFALSTPLHGDLSFVIGDFALLQIRRRQSDSLRAIACQVVVLPDLSTLNLPPSPELSSSRKQRNADLTACNARPPTSAATSSRTSFPQASALEPARCVYHQPSRSLRSQRCLVPSALSSPRPSSRVASPSAGQPRRPPEAELAIPPKWPTTAEDTIPMPCQRTCLPLSFRNSGLLFRVAALRHHDYATPPSLAAQLPADPIPSF